jgi:hypothetical protein
MTEVIPDLDRLTPTISETSNHRSSDEGHNPGFDIFKFIKSQLTQPTHFRDLCRAYTDGLSERKWQYWVIFSVCVCCDLAYYIFIHALMLVTLTILVYGFAKAVGFTDWITNSFHAVQQTNAQIQYVTPSELNKNIQTMNKNLKIQQTNEKTDFLELQAEIKQLKAPVQSSLSATKTR